VGGWIDGSYSDFMDCFHKQVMQIWPKIVWLPSFCNTKTIFKAFVSCCCSNRLSCPFYYLLASTKVEQLVLLKISPWLDVCLFGSYSCFVFRLYPKFKTLPNVQIAVWMIWSRERLITKRFGAIITPLQGTSILLMLAC
jgi:hypothetical protein